MYGTKSWIAMGGMSAAWARFGTAPRNMMNCFGKWLTSYARSIKQTSSKLVTRKSTFTGTENKMDNQNQMPPTTVTLAEFTQFPVDLPKMVETLQVQLIRIALHQTAGNTTHASKLLGLTRPTLIYKMKCMGLES